MRTHNHHSVVNCDRAIAWWQVRLLQLLPQYKQEAPPLGSY